MATESGMIDGFQRVTAVDYGARFYRTDLHFHTPVTLFMEKIKESQFEYYSLGQENGNRYLYSINKEENTAKKLEWSELDGLGLMSHFYDPVEVSRWISTGDSMSDFLSQRFGLPTPGNIDRFNETFAVPFFLEARPTDGFYSHPSDFNEKKQKQEFLPVVEGFSGSCLEEEKQPLLTAQAESGKWKLSLDVQWNKGMEGSNYNPG